MERRTCLRAAGGLALALPFLEIMQPRRARAATVPKRFLVWSTPNGTVLDRWICRRGDTPEDFTLSDILSPLARHKGDLVGLQNLQQYGGHAHHLSSSLTGRRFTDRAGRISATGRSLDQQIAAAWRRETPIASLQIGVGVVQNREGSSAASWEGPDRPLPPENSPFALYARLFGNGTGAAQQTVAQALSLRRSALDSVMTPARGFSRQLGRDDRALLDDYLSSLREIERQMDALGARTALCTKPALGSDPTAAGAKPWWLENDNVPTVIRLHLQLITAIFACDLTRVITFNLANDGGAHRLHPWIPESPLGMDWHGCSHTVEKGKPEALVAIERWYYGQLANLVDGLKAVRTPDGRSLFFHTLLLTNNEYGPNGGVESYDGGKGNLSHYSRLMPYLLLGQAGGALRTGRYLVYPIEKDATGVHHTRLLVSVLNALGFPDQSFGDPAAMQGPLPGLLG